MIDRMPSPEPKMQPVCVAKIILITLLSIVCSGTLSAQRSERTIFQFQHTGWTAKDGAPAPTYAFAQTTDGIRFESYSLPAGMTSHPGDVRSLMATPDGVLWIGLNSGGAVFLKDGHTISYDQSNGLPAGAVFQFTVDQQGTLWAGTITGLARFDGSRWHPVGENLGFSGKSAKILFIDHAGTLWVASEDALFFLT